MAPLIGGYCGETGGFPIIESSLLGWCGDDGNMMGDAPSGEGYGAGYEPQFELPKRSSMPILGESGSWLNDDRSDTVLPVLALRVARGAGNENPTGMSVDRLADALGSNLSPLPSSLSPAVVTVSVTVTAVADASAAVFAAAAATAAAADAAAAASSSSAFLDFFGAPNAFTQALKFGVDFALVDSDEVAAAVVDDDDDVVDSAGLATGVTATAVAASTSAIISAVVSSFFFSSVFSFACNSVEVIISSSSISSESLDRSSDMAGGGVFSSLKLCCRPNPNPAVSKTLPKLNLGPVSLSG